MVKDEQVRLLRQKRMEGKSQESAAAAAGMCVRSARDWEEGAMPSQTTKRRHWRTRADPFAGIWEAEVEPLLRRDEEGVLEATTVINELQERHAGRFTKEHLRTMQRRIRDWRALHGPAREVFFPQQHVAGREAAIDFTHMTELGITIAGQVFKHLLFQFVLSFSGWTWACIAFGETFESLLQGIQGALWKLGGVPSIIRSDNLSAATHELFRSKGRGLNRRYKELLDHYGCDSTRIRPGESHENGIVEQAHRRVKSAVRQALLLRGSQDFPSIATYLEFLTDVIDRSRNRGIERRLAEERQALRPLPAIALPSYTQYEAVVRRWSTIRVNDRTYSVPSRLIGHKVTVRQFPDVLEVYYRNALVLTMPRIEKERSHFVDYRHVIWSLVRKPGAFARYRYREDLFPSLTFRRAYDALRDSRGDRADIEYVRILHLAASTMQSTVQQALEILLEKGAPFDFVTVKSLAHPERYAIPKVSIPAPDLSAYDALLVGRA